MLAFCSTSISRTALAAPLAGSSRSQCRQPRHFAVRAEEGTVATESKSLETMRKFSEQYAKRTDTFFCVDKSVTAVVIQGLAENKDELGAPLCPCRHYDDKQAEAQQGFWNCPCVPMRERRECHCMLFLPSDNDFAGEEQQITIEEVKAAVNM